MELKSQLMDEAQVRRSLARISHEIIEKNQGAENICLLGIKRRGLPLAGIIAECIREIEGVAVPVGELDISSFRDDRKADVSPETVGCRISCELEGKTVILVDDVLHTGRTVRAAIEAVIREGRPAAIRLAVLIDRGHRELPIRADYVGKNVPTSHLEVISVRVPEYDGTLGADLYSL